MDEQNALRRAQLYIEKPANGIDPVTDMPVPEGDVIQQVQISRCLFYVSGLLRRMEKERSTSSQEKNVKLPFCLSRSQRDYYIYSDMPTTLSDIVKRLNALKQNDKMENLKYRTLADWLVQQGKLMRWHTSGGKQTLRPAAAGRNEGILMRERHDREGKTYYVVLYENRAQRYILEHLDEIRPRNGT